MGFHLRFSDHYRNVRFNNTRLFRRNKGQGIAQKVHVVKTDIGNDAQFRYNDVGGVQPPSQPYFDNGNIYRLPGKIVESHSDGYLKKGRLNAVDQRLASLHKINHLLAWNILAIDLDPFPEVAVMRRDIKANAPAGSLQYRSQHVRSRPLSIGAGNVQAGKTLFGMAQGFTKRPDIRKVFLESCRPNALKHRQLAIEKIQRLLVLIASG